MHAASRVRTMPITESGPVRRLRRQSTDTRHFVGASAHGQQSHRRAEFMH
jgi:hypothetical protein